MRGVKRGRLIRGRERERERFAGEERERERARGVTFGSVAAWLDRLRCQRGTVLE